jgi:hypothetical protein
VTASIVDAASISAANADDTALMKTARNTVKLRKMTSPARWTMTAQRMRRFHNQGMHSVAFCRRTFDLSGQTAGKFSRRFPGKEPIQMIDRR